MIHIIPVHFKGMANLLLEFPYVILVVARGKGSLSFAGGTTEMLPRRLFFLRNQDAPRYQGEVEGYLLGVHQLLLNFFFFHNQGPWFLSLFDQPLPHMDQQEKPFLFTLSLLKQICTMLEDKAGFHATQKYMLLLLTHLNVDLKAAEPLEDRGSRLIQQMLLLIEVNFKSRRETGFYADLMGLSSRRLNALSKQYQGKRFFELLMERLLLEADILLYQTDLPLKSIAYELGFSNPTHFSTYYSRSRGFSPSVFRRGMTKQ